MKPKSKKVGVIGIVIAILLIAVIITVDVLCATFSSLIGLYFRGETSTAEAKADFAYLNISTPQDPTV